jgi:hypothetical protein
MKKILASLAAAVAVTGFASGAYAQSAPVTSSGTITAACTVSVTDGTLAQTSDRIIDSTAAPGTIETKCNSTTSKLETNLTSFTEPATANPAANAYTVEYKLNGGTRAYNPNSANPASYTTGAYNTYATGVGSEIDLSDLSFGLINQSSKVDVVARGRVNNNAQLIAGSYSIVVTTLVTP